MGRTERHEAMSAWEEATDEAGRTYFWNTSTGEARWDRPPEIEVSSRAGSVSMEGSGWERQVASGSGVAYFYHAATGESAWEHPPDIDRNTRSSDQDGDAEPAPGAASSSVDSKQSVSATELSPAEIQPDAIDRNTRSRSSDQDGDGEETPGAASSSVDSDNSISATEHSPAAEEHSAAAARAASGDNGLAPAVASVCAAEDPRDHADAALESSTVARRYTPRPPSSPHPSSFVEPVPADHSASVEDAKDASKTPPVEEAASRPTATSLIKPAEDRRSPSRRIQCGAFLIVSLFAGLILPPWLTRPSDDDGAGELIITRGGSTSGSQEGTKLLAPCFVHSGEPIPTEGTAEAKLIWIESPCAGTLNCDTCPPKIDLAFNASILNGAVLIVDYLSDERLYVCGFNWMGRGLGNTGLVAVAGGYRMADGRLADNPLFTPGYLRKEYRRGAYRDSKPHDGDAGIPFPQVDLRQATLLPILDALEEGDDIRVVLRTSQPNPYLVIMYGPWVPMRALIILGHILLAERSASFFAGHVLMNGVRPDLAQMALVAEGFSHAIFALYLHDPHMSFYTSGWPPLGGASALLMGPLFLTCCSTLLLAVYWHQMIQTAGLASVVVQGPLGISTAVVSGLLGIAAGWMMITEVSRDREFRIEQSCFAISALTSR